MNALNKAIKDLNEPIFNKIRAKCGGKKTEMESSILKVLDSWVKNG